MPWGWVSLGVYRGPISHPFMATLTPKSVYPKSKTSDEFSGMLPPVLMMSQRLAIRCALSIRINRGTYVKRAKDESERRLQDFSPVR